MATDLAEILGAALGIYLLFDLPLFAAGLVAGAAAFAILALQARGFRRLEAVIAAFVGVIMLSFGAQVFIADPSPTGALHGLVPGFSGSESVLLAVGILGATVMPHVIYLHSALTQNRIVGADEEARRRIFRFEHDRRRDRDGLAGVINVSTLLTAACALPQPRPLEVGHDPGDVFDALGTPLGGQADLLFGIGLLASGLSSSSVGTLAGQVVMQGFIHRQIPIFLRAR